MVINLLNQVKGILACGYVGKGRLEEPEKIVELVQEFFQAIMTYNNLRGKSGHYSRTNKGKN